MITFYTVVKLLDRLFLRQLRKSTRIIKTANANSTLLIKVILIIATPLPLLPDINQLIKSVLSLLLLFLILLVV